MCGYFCSLLIKNILNSLYIKGVVRGSGLGGLGDSTPPQKKNQIFFKSEGKEVERKRKKNEKG